MAKGLILAPINVSFRNKIKSLAKEGAEIVASHADLTERMLRFAAAFREATKEAERLDQQDDGDHARYMREQLADAINSENNQIWSRWNTIGTYANTLMKYSDRLPPQRDSLYQIALAAKDKLPVATWVRSSEITIDSTVRDLSALRKSALSPTAKKTSSKKSSSKRNRHLNAQVTLSFEKFSDAVEALQNLILERGDFEISAEKAFAEALKASIGIENYAEIEERIR